MTKVKTIGYIWGLTLNQYILILFAGNWVILSWDIANKIFTWKSKGKVNDHTKVMSVMIMVRND